MDFGEIVKLLGNGDSLKEIAEAKSTAKVKEILNSKGLNVDDDDIRSVIEKAKELLGNKGGAEAGLGAVIDSLEDKTGIDLDKLGGLGGLFKK